MTGWLKVSSTPRYTEILLKLPLNTNQSIRVSKMCQRLATSLPVDCSFNELAL